MMLKSRRSSSKGKYSTTTTTSKQQQYDNDEEAPRRRNQRNNSRQPQRQRRQQWCLYTSITTLLALVAIAWTISSSSSPHHLDNNTTTFFTLDKPSMFGDSVTTSYPEFTYPTINVNNASSFPPTCPQQVHTYIFQNGKVAWASPGSFSYQQRGMSIHCMLSRAAHRMPFLDVSIRIGMADVDLNASLSFQPASEDVFMRNVTTAPLLFPDSTFESWSEVHDYSLPQSVAGVWNAAQKFGSPGSSKQEWMEKRINQLVWRGSAHGKERKELIALSPTHASLNIEAIDYNLTKDGIKLTSSNQISRSDICHYKFLLHMNGIFNNRYSSSIKWKLLCGSLVFVPTQPLFVEWWNYGDNQMKPFVHYVPFTNAKDLMKQLDYYQSHLDEAVVIAQQGQALAQRALDGVEHFIDTMLQQYQDATHHLHQPRCWPSIRKNDSAVPLKFKSLQDLQQQYGPQVCA